MSTDSTISSQRPRVICHMAASLDARKLRDRRSGVGSASYGRYPMQSISTRNPSLGSFETSTVVRAGR